MRVLVLGGYGLIGREIVRRLLAEGHSVAGLGRSVAVARRRMPQVDWIEADMSRLTDPANWASRLGGVEVVVNAAGALQDSPRDDLRAIHVEAVGALVHAAGIAGVKRLVQVSAVGATPEAATAFLRTKALGDAAVRGARSEWVILRPGLVIAPIAYGGTALLRALAAFPLVTPLVRADSPVQTIGVADVAAAVADAVAGRIPSGAELDLVEPELRSLAETVAQFRAWLGLPPARVARLPDVLAAPIRAGADLLGLLGWRSPLRTTALAVMAQGVTGDPVPARAMLGRGFAPLPQVLSTMPAGVAELWFARLWLLKPLVLGGLAAFWATSGLVGFAQAGRAAAILTERGMGPSLATAAVLAGSAVDLALGLGVLVRPLARPALLGMISVTAAYMAGSLVFAPDLWLDPLGPMVKAWPAAVLALVGLALLDER